MPCSRSSAVRGQQLVLEVGLDPPEDELVAVGVAPAKVAIDHVAGEIVGEQPVRTGLDEGEVAEPVEHVAARRSESSAARSKGSVVTRARAQVSSACRCRGSGTVPRNRWTRVATRSGESGRPVEAAVPDDLVGQQRQAERMAVADLQQAPVHRLGHAAAAKVRPDLPPGSGCAGRRRAAGPATRDRLASPHRAAAGRRGPSPRRREIRQQAARGSSRRAPRAARRSPAARPSAPTRHDRRRADHAGRCRSPRGRSSGEGRRSRASSRTTRIPQPVGLDGEGVEQAGLADTSRAVQEEHRKRGRLGVQTGPEELDLRRAADEALPSARDQHIAQRSVAALGRAPSHATRVPVAGVRRWARTLGGDGPGHGGRRAPRTTVTVGAVRDRPRRTSRP